LNAHGYRILPRYEEVSFMKLRQVVPTAVALAALLISPAMSDDSGRAARASAVRADSGFSLTCRVVRKAPKPFLEAVEDGIAYILDIPLAMLSPLTCPIVAPIMERLDSGPDRQYDRCMPR
jgi:hypothetical protein